MTLYEIVKKLVGPISPVGETNCDNKRFENLKIMTQLITLLVTDIDDVAMEENSHMYSVKRAGKFASEWCLQEWEKKNENQKT